MRVPCQPLTISTNSSPLPDRIVDAAAAHAHPHRRGSAASSAFEAQVRLGLQRDDLLDGRRVVAEVDPVAGTELQRAH
jgi:hypothetical protein